VTWPGAADAARAEYHGAAMNHPLLPAAALLLGVAGVAAQDTRPDASPFREPFRLCADGKPIDIGKLSKFAHAGPCLADVDGDGDRDLVVGDFPGNFWLFENIGDDKKPVYAARGQLQAGGEAAKTPVY
jgi:hypothetical protein